MRHWAEDELVYDVAQKNIPNVDRIELLVDKYRRELFVHEYQKQILSEKLGCRNIGRSGEKLLSYSSR